MIRPLLDTDHKIAKELFQRNFHSSEDVYFVPAWKSRNRDHSFGLWIHGSLLGIAIVKGSKLEYICIEPTQHSKGWGSMLLQHVVSVCPTLHLIPADDNKLCRWYEKQGFYLSREDEFPNYTMRCYVRHTHDTRKHGKIDGQ